MKKITIEGSSDLHVHSYPSLFNRIGDDRAIVSAAVNAGMRALVLKSHHESTVSRAYLVNSEFPAIEVYGGIVLNSFVGGINPAAVEAALRLGAKVVWMPTVDKTISTLKPHNCILVSDAGQAHNPMPAEALRILAQCLYERGVGEDNLRIMLVDKPAELLGLMVK